MYTVCVCVAVGALHTILIEWHQYSIPLFKLYIYNTCNSKYCLVTSHLHEEQSKIYITINWSAFTFLRTPHSSALIL